MDSLFAEAAKQQANQDSKAREDPVQVRKMFQQVVLAKEKAEATKAKADKEVQKLHEELLAAKKV